MQSYKRAGAGWEKIDAAGEWKFETLFDENSKIKAFSAITPGSNLLIKADYVNPGSAKSAVLIAAYYNDDKLVGVETISVESGIEDFSAGEIFRNTSVPNTAFDEMAIYCRSEGHTSELQSLKRSRMPSSA